MDDPLKPGRVRYVGRAAGRFVRDPVDSTDRVLERVAAVTERMTGHGKPDAYPQSEDWEPLLHARLGVEWPCPERAEFEALWSP